MRRLAERIRGIRNQKDGRKVEKTKKKRKEREKYSGSGGFIQRSDLYPLENKKKGRGKEKSARSREMRELAGEAAGSWCLARW